MKTKAVKTAERQAQKELKETIQREKRKQLDLQKASIEASKVRKI